MLTMKNHGCYFYRLSHLTHHFYHHKIPSTCIHRSRLCSHPNGKRQGWVHHPAIDYMRRYFTFDEPFDEETIRRLHSAYYGICTFLDTQIGRVLDKLDKSGLRDTTRIIYTSDHGEHLGSRGIYGKFTMYEEASAIPFIMAGADIPVWQSCQYADFTDRLLPDNLGCGWLSDKRR